MLLQQIKLAGAGKALDLSIVQDKTYILTKKNQQGTDFMFRQLAMGGGQNDEGMEMLRTSQVLSDKLC